MSVYQTNENERLATAFRALAHPHRVSLFRRLLDCCGGEGCCRPEEEMGACVGELGRDLGIAPSTVSHHVKELRQAGLLRLTRRGRNIECRVCREAVEELVAFLTRPLLRGTDAAEGE